MRDSGMWENDQQRSPRSGTGRASQGKTSKGSKMDQKGSGLWKSEGYTAVTPNKRSSGEGAVKRPSATAGLRGSKIQVGDGDWDDKSSS